MKTHTVTVREGEWLGPIDWSYDFTQYGHPDIRKDGLAALRAMGESTDGWVYCPSGFSTFAVVCVGMYGGWPFWKPTPAIGYIGPFNSVEVAFYYDLGTHLFRGKPGPDWGAIFGRTP